MAYKDMLIEESEGMGASTINRPEARSALGRSTWLELRSLLADMATDQGVQVVTITRSGDKAFAAGAHVRALSERTMLETLLDEEQSVLNRARELARVGDCCDEWVGGGWRM